MGEWEEKKRREAKKRIVPSKTHQSRVEDDKKEDGREARERRRRARDKKGENRYKFIVFTLFVAIVIMGVYVLFFVQKIGLKGNEYHGPSETIEWIKDDKYSSNSIYLYVKYNYKDVDLPVYLESLEVKLEAPWSVKLVVKEKAMIGGVELPDRYAYFDSDGVVIYQSELLLEAVPLVEGLEVAEVTLYEKVPVDDEIFENVLTATTALENNGIAIDSISCGAGATITLGIGGVTIQLGDNQLEDKIIQIPSVMEKIGDQSGTLRMENFDVNDGTISFVKEKSAE